MKLVDLISELQEIIDKADMALDGGDSAGAKASLREARDMLDDAFLKD